MPPFPQRDTRDLSFSLYFCNVELILVDCFLTAFQFDCINFGLPLTGHANDQVFPVWPSELEVCDAAGPSTHVGLQNQLPIYPSLPSRAHGENYHLHSNWC